MSVLMDHGDNFLTPSPGFSLYITVAQNRGFEARVYNCLPEQDWEADLEHMQSLIDERTKLIVVINPSNPLGAVYSKEHLLAILELAKRNHLPVLADEIYAHMVFEGEFHSLGHLTDEVPVIVMGGLSKRWLVPGWRLGWGALHDPKHLFEGRFDEGVFKVRNVMIHASTYLI
jgi:tyrosine aminotransferase